MHQIVLFFMCSQHNENHIGNAGFYIKSSLPLNYCPLFVFLDEGFLFCWEVGILITDINYNNEAIKQIRFCYIFLLNRKYGFKQQTTRPLCLMVEQWTTIGLDLSTVDRLTVSTFRFGANKTEQLGILVQFQ
jgi:hypothetical protein